MIKTIGLISAFFLISSSAFSQTTNVSGVITDAKEKTAVYNSVVALLTPVDSILYKFTRSDKQGKFNFKNVKSGNYILMTSHNQYGDYVDVVNANTPELKLGNIALISKMELLREVVIKTGSIRIKGDTTSYRASDFKVDANANVEELLKKLPGIQVDKNGVIKAMGETVQKVLVDGEEFFGDDPGMAVKNLRADAVKEVQVFNKKSEQAEFTGIDDGKTQKTINLKLKEDKKKGYFGKIDGANEPFSDEDSRYNTNLMVSSFKGKRKLSAFLLNGNTGQDGLSWEDSEKFGARDGNISMNMDDDGNVSYEWVGGSNDGEPYVNTQNGFTKNTNAGLQYTNKWNEKQNLNVSPKFNNQIYTNNNKRFSQSQIGDTFLNDNSTNITNVNRSNFKLNASYEVKLDTLNTIKFSAKTNFYKTESDDFTDRKTTGEADVLKNKQQRIINTDSDKSSLSANFLFKHKFAKPRRTFSLSSSWSLLSTNSNNFLKSSNESYVNGLLDSKIDVNQNKIGDRSNQNLTASASYSEPIAKQLSLQFSYQLTYDKGKNNYFTYDYSDATGKYDQLVNSLSNQFEQQVITQRPNLKLSYNAKKINYSIGSGFGFTTFDLQDFSTDKEYKRNYTNFFPSANFLYRYKNNSRLSVDYQGSTRQPSMEQLQPLRNNQDFFNQSLGNPDLKQSFTHRFNFNQSSYNMLTETQIYQGLSINSTSNQIIYNSTIDPETAKTISRPINSNGNLWVNYYIGYGFKIKKLNLNTDFHPNFNYSKSVISINDKIYDTKNLSSGLLVYLYKSKQKQYDVSLSNRFSYNRSSTTQNNTVKSYNTNEINFNLGYYLGEKWKFSTDYNLNMRQKTVDFQDNLTNQLWNARLQRTFKKDEFTGYIMIRDILNQNIGINRNVYQNSISQEQNDRLKRYVMIGFTWNFKNGGETKK